MEEDNRVVVLVDMDCFYCQVEEKLNPELAGKPIAVVQYNPWKGGGIIAVNYVARGMGVTRHMRGDEARKKCPEIQLPSVPCQRGKADITKYRDAGKEVVKVLQKYTTLLERASIDEAYLDITDPVQERLKTLNVNTITNKMMPNTFALGYDNLEEFVSEVLTCGSDSIEFDYDHAKRLLVGAVIVSEMRAAVYTETGYRCSAGIAHNKILAKLVCGMNKPNKQTILPKHAVNILYKTLPLKKVKHLGGKFGDYVCQILRINKMAELQQFSEKELQTKFDEKNGTWLYNMARGINLEPVQSRLTPKSIGCCKQLRGNLAINYLDRLRKWLRDLGDEIEDRLEKDALENNRTPKQMVVSYSIQLPNKQDSSSSRSYNFLSDDYLCGDLFSSKALELLMESAEGVRVQDDEQNRKLRAPIKFLGISVGKFEDNAENKKVKKIKDYFNTGSSKQTISKAKEVQQENEQPENCQSNNGKEFVSQKKIHTSIHEPQKDKNEAQINDTNNQKLIKTDLEKQQVPCSSQPKNKQPDNYKSNDGKEFVLRKFFQIPSESCENKSEEKVNDANKKSIETTLDKQESFFAKFLNRNVPNMNVTIKSTMPADRPTTPACHVVQCGDDSNDTDYSGSTINMEINKSIALFEDDAEEVARVSNIRQLLDSSKIFDTDENSDTANDSEQVKPEQTKNFPTDTNRDYLETLQTIQCPECKKTISIENLDTHSDYHLALKLRSEERESYRKEREKAKDVEEKSNRSDIIVHKQQPKKSQIEVSPSEKLPSVANFLVRLDDTIATEICTECGKKVPVEKLAEHFDYHEAQKLSRLLNNKPNPVSITGSITKRKRKSTSPVKKAKFPCKTIDLFFRQ